jgi:2-hydroxycyclohexanecarboxyl-CoA dehydrogenase
VRLQGKTAMVTGAGRGIGEAIAAALAAAGAAVAVCDLDGPAAAKAAAGIAERHGALAVGVPVDITDSAAIRAAVSRAQSELGPLDILVNNAGIDVIELFTDSAEETWDKIIAVNLRGTITVTRAVLDQMIERGGGRIIHIASDAGRVGSANAGRPSSPGTDASTTVRSVQKIMGRTIPGSCGALRLSAGRLGRRQRRSWCR